MCAEGNPKLSEGSDNNLHRQNLSVLWWNMKPWKMLEDEGLKRRGEDGRDGWMDDDLLYWLNHHNIPYSPLSHQGTKLHNKVHRAPYTSYPREAGLCSSEED